MGEQEISRINIKISHIDYLLICHIKELRIKNGLSQLELSQKMNLADGFVSKVEAFTERAKYSIRHLKLLADAFSCSINEVIPQYLPEFDYVNLQIKKAPKINKDGSVSSKQITLIEKVTPINERR